MEDYKIIASEEGIVIVDKNCAVCGIPLRLTEYLDYKNVCEECINK